LPGSGKSYFAYRLADMTKANYISSDQLRKNLFPERTYSEKEKLLVYAEMLSQMKEHIRQNKNLVFDGTFYTNAIRKQFNFGEVLYLPFKKLHSLIFSHIGEQLSR